jgi:hypothetical protein
LHAVQSMAWQLRLEIKEVRDGIDKLMALIKAYHTQISTAKLIKYIDKKIEVIYFDHASWELGERDSVIIDWVKELSKQHKGAELSDKVQQWLASNFTQQVPPVSFTSPTHH